MAQFRTGDMWLEFPNSDIVFLATTNGMVKHNGCLVMGRGNALTMAQKIPEAPRLFGEYVKAKGEFHYLILKVRGSLQTGQKFGAFQTKLNWRDPSDLDLIDGSVAKLTKAAEQYPEFQFYLPFPGIGNGGLTREYVLPAISDLPNNVVIWEK